MTASHVAVSPRRESRIEHVTFASVAYLPMLGIQLRSSCVGLLGAQRRRARRSAGLTPSADVGGEYGESYKDVDNTLLNYLTYKARGAARTKRGARGPSAPPSDSAYAPFRRCA